MTSLSLGRSTWSSRKGRTAASVGRLARFVAEQLALLRTSMDAAAAYERAPTPAARRAVLDRFLSQISS